MVNAANLLVKLNIPTDVEVPDMVTFSAQSLFNNPYMVFNNAPVPANNYRSKVDLLSDSKTINYYFNKSTPVWQSPGVEDVVFLSARNLLNGQDNSVVLNINKNDSGCRSANQLSNPVKVRKTPAADVNFSISLSEGAAQPPVAVGLQNGAANGVSKYSTSPPGYNVTVNHTAANTGIDYFETYRYTALNAKNLTEFDTTIEIGSSTPAAAARPIIINLNKSLPRSIILDVKLYNNYIPARLVSITNLRADAGTSGIITSPTELGGDYNQDFSSDFLVGLNGSDYSADFNNDFLIGDSIRQIAYDSIRVGQFNNAFNFDFNRWRSTVIKFIPDAGSGFWDTPNAEAIMLYTLRYMGHDTANYIVIRNN